MLKPISSFQPARLNQKSNIESPSFTGLVTTEGLSMRKSNSGYVTTSMLNDMVGQQVHTYMSTQPATRVFEGAQIVSVEEKD